MVSKWLGLVAVAAVAACVPAPRGPVDLRDADVKEIRFQLRHPRAAICPGEPVPLDVAMDVKVDGERMTVRQRRDEIDEPIFSLDDLYLESPQGKFVDGAFLPSGDARVSLGSGFVFYARAPRGPAFAIRFPPYYECGGKIGGTGIDAVAAWNRSEPSNDNSSGRSEAIYGTPHSDLTDGIDGGKGPTLKVYVTWVQTADYTRLLAGRSEGDIDMLTLVAPGYPLNVIATGGHGGDGGKGIQGATGGGNGGVGGSGGKGGDGGNVEVVLDDRYPELEKLVNVDVSGGPGGHYGPGGAGGPRELAAVQHHHRRSHDTTDYVPVGEPGKPGFPGIPGKRGDDGTLAISKGDVHPKFAGVAGLTVL